MKLCEVSGCERAIFGRGMCQAHHARWYRHRDIQSQIPIDNRGRSRSPIVRLLQRIIVQGHCWIWNGAVSGPPGRGYGILWDHTIKRLVKAHRRSYELFRGTIPIGFEIDHICRNRLCINPDHLYVVTHSENIKRGFASRRADRWVQWVQ